MPVMASVALVVGSLAAANPWVSGALFLATIFNSFEMRRFGPRGAGLGTISYQSFFYAMLFKTPPDKIGWLPVFVFVGCAIAFAVHFWLVAEHPGRMLKSEVRAYRARVDVLLHDLVRWLDKDGKAARKRIDAHLAALNALSLGLDGRLAGFARSDADAAHLREHVLRSELAVETIADVVRAQACDGASRRALADRLRELEAVAGKRAPGFRCRQTRAGACARRPTCWSGWRRGAPPCPRRATSRRRHPRHPRRRRRPGRAPASRPTGSTTPPGTRCRPARLDSAHC
jgi:hypothetical protein